MKKIYRKVFLNTSKGKKEGYICRLKNNNTAVVMLLYKPRHIVIRPVCNLYITEEYVDENERRHTTRHCRKIRNNSKNN